MDNFTKWIRRELLAMGTMTDTAKKVGTSPQQLCKWYQGRNRPNLQSFKKLCEVIADYKEVPVEQIYIEALANIKE
jgi:DNA-binding XRE family transcriptional regulator